jgi:hypothetical protein
MGKRRTELTNKPNMASLTDLEFDFFIDDGLSWDLAELIPVEAASAETAR